MGFGITVSKRHPELIQSSAVRSDYPKHQTDGCWGFTVVRREAEGFNIKTPLYSYLAPLDSATSPRAGRVLRFEAAELPIFPQGHDAYLRNVGHGTLVKLYEYNLKNVSNILRRSGLRPKIDLLLPEPALPMRFHECRKELRTDETHIQVETMSGLFARLSNNKNLEEISPSNITITVNGRELIARIFAFKPKTSDTYRSEEGIIFTINGQAQGYIKASFFARKKVGLPRLAKDLLVVLDCSHLSALEQNDMFMPSRDRLVDDNALAMEIEKQLEIVLHDHHGLRELKNARQKLDVEEQLADNKPLEDVLKRVLKTSPTLARLFGQGERLQNPFKPDYVQKSEDLFVGKPHPTYFRFLGREQDATLARKAHLENRVKISFETDVVDDYFTRKIDHGIKKFLYTHCGKTEALQEFHGPNLSNGRGNLSFALPDFVKLGDVFELEFIIHDPVMGNEFKNHARLTIEAESDAKAKKMSKSPKQTPPGQLPGPNKEGQAGLNLPKVHWVKKTDSNWETYFETTDDCLKILEEEAEQKFYLNEENKSLQTELKFTKLTAAAVKKQFEIGIVLIGMALLHDDNKKNLDTKEVDDLSSRVAEFTRAIAPVVLPMIQGLGDLTEDDVDLSDQVGQAG